MRKWIAALGALALICVVVIVAVVLWDGSSSNGSTQHKTASAKLVSTTSAAKCWTVRYNANQGYRVLSNGVPKQDQGNPQKTVNYLLGAAKQDPRALQAEYNAWATATNHPAVADYHVFVNGSCYSQDGQNAWNEVAVYYRTATVQNSTAPATGCNTSVTPGGQATCTVEAITGNRSGISVVFIGTTQTVWVMYRCGNPVTAAPPASTTTSPPPAIALPPPATTTTVPTCPPGQHPSPLNGVCIAPKDPSQDPLNNPSVPPIVKGQGTTPANGDPGPATQPVDTPCGFATCPSPTTTTTQPDTTTTTTQPPSQTPVSNQPPASGDPGPPSSD
jgi:hypothetical protein